MGPVKMEYDKIKFIIEATQPHLLQWSIILMDAIPLYDEDDDEIFGSLNIQTSAM